MKIMKCIGRTFYDTYVEVFLKYYKRKNTISIIPFVIVIVPLRASRLIGYLICVSIVQPCFVHGSYNYIMFLRVINACDADLGVLRLLPLYNITRTISCA